MANEDELAHRRAALATDEGRQAITESIQLDRVQLCNVKLLEHTLLEGMRKDVRVCDHVDAYEMRRAFAGWGRVESRTLTCPATWWDHMKLALRTRWPRLLSRLRVVMDSVTVENGALVTGLSKKLSGRHAVIAVAMPTTRMRYVEDNSDDDPEQS